MFPSDGFDHGQRLPNEYQAWYSESITASLSDFLLSAKRRSVSYGSRVMNLVIAEDVAIRAPAPSKLYSRGRA
jgi:hypothetical protein